MNDLTLHEHFMRAAIAQANLADPKLTRPNPRVGSIIVEEGEIVSAGCFERDGGPHAERIALESLGRKPKSSATLYVTLEPCSTKGRTGACTEAIVESGLKNVVVGAIDPTGSHSGNGLKILRDAGLNVVSNVLLQACIDLNPEYEGRETAPEGERSG